MVFSYPQEAHQCRHGPQGYAEYSSYKPWLRDEYVFRCFYCLSREVWFPDGEANFGIDHFQPQRLAPGQITDYHNMLYACLGCNASKRDGILSWDPRLATLSVHLQVSADGTVRGLTPQGWELIDACRLNRPRLTEYRRRMSSLLDALQERKSAEAQKLLRAYLGFPTDLPNLAALRPPSGNTRPEGIAMGYYEVRKRGELPDTY